MRRSREAAWLLIILMAGTLWGCASPPREDERWPQARSHPQESRTLPPDKTPVVNLRIPEATAPAQPSPNSSVVQASAAQLPAASVPPIPNTSPPANKPGFLEKPGSPDATTSDRLLQIARAANENYAHIDSYIARLRRKEQINGKDKPEEVMLLKFRKQPWSV